MACLLNVSALDQFIESNFTSGGPGAAILLKVNDETVYQKTVGLANVEKQEQVTPLTNFRLASVSKQFTAMGIALLEQRGKLNFQDSLLKFFPDFGATGESLTLQHLLNHTSGLLDYEAFVSETREEQVADQEVLQITTGHTHTYFTPGSEFRYSNTGYVLLGLIIEQVSGKSLQSFLEENIFRPLGMYSTTLYAPTIPIPHRAMGYAQNDLAETVFSDQSTCSATKGDGCLYTSVQEYELWHEALKENPRFDLETLLRKSSAVINSNRNWHYGMGWFFSERQDGSLEMYHTGNTCGFSNLVVRLPAHDLLLICLTNIANNHLLLPDLVQKVLKTTSVELASNLIYALPELTR
ncbi:serine hydrolase domain-containing protein [Rufibacter roseus]|uniref:Serine hydrolase domain-containing protein n=1 Tax=Rufibacter roseus TaxID=1567108 RepID=A0ABW2DPQ0_9BACT|nr:serine hydrolase domain-containing protein [Rufibacter roseus]